MHAHTCHDGCMGPEDSLRYDPSLFEMGFLLIYLCSPGWGSMSFQRSSCLQHPSSHRGIRITDMSYCAWLSMGFGDLNSCPDVCAAKGLPTKPRLFILITINNTDIEILIYKCICRLIFFPLILIFLGYGK